MSAVNLKLPKLAPLKRIALVLGAAVAVAACQGDRIATGTIPVSATGHVVAHAGAEHVVLDLPAAHRGMSEAERGAVRDFVNAYRRDGHGALEVLGPSGSNNEVESQLVVGEVRRLAYAGGIPSTAVSYSSYRSKEPTPPVVLRYQRYVATAKCGHWPTNVASDWRNVPYENFGCATQKNLAAMVEDPRDLYGPRPMTPRDAERRDQVFENYRRGQPTGARTGTDSAGTASNVGG